MPSAALRRRLCPTLVPSYSTLCRPAFIPAPRLSQAFIRWGFGTVPGFAWIRCASFKPFGPLALVQQALAAIIFAALCRFRGPALFHGSRPSSRLGAPFWPSGLTVRRSRPPTAAAELRALACEKPALFSPMFYLPAFTFSSGYSLGFGFLAGLRLLVLRQFQTFFASIAPPPWRTAFSRFALVVNLGLPVLASGSNRAVKPTRLRRAAYFRSLGLKGVTASPIRCIRKSRCLCQQCHYQKMELVLQAIPNKETCAFLTQMQSPQYREMEYVHLGGLSRGITA